MNDLFKSTSQKKRPLADLLRPQTLNDVLGQGHILGSNKPLTRMLESKQLASLILWGPPGCGKTTIAHLIAQAVDMKFVKLSAVLSGVADLRKVYETAEKIHELGQQTLLFVDEIHRFNRSQQDSFLAHIEKGIIVLIGATTENPSFELNGALLSRTQVLPIYRLDEASLDALIERAEAYLKHSLNLTKDARQLLRQMADGDGRALLNMIETLSSSAQENQKITPEILMTLLQRRAPLYDKSQDGHYNLISALHKSLRGSDVDASLYWLARMLEGGERPLYILRRLVRFASEDIGLADPNALTQAIAATESYKFLGSPEGDLALAQCVIYLATAPKSNASYTAFKQASQSARENGSLSPPLHILNAPTKLMKSFGYGKEYHYDHDEADAFSGQDYFPEDMKRRQYYHPVERGFEREILKRLTYWEKLRRSKQNS